MAGKTDAPKMLGANGFKYREQFGVIVICKDEAEHKIVYERLKAQGYKCKVCAYDHPHPPSGPGV